MIGSQSLISNLRIALNLQTRMSLWAVLIGSGVAILGARAAIARYATRAGPRIADAARASASARVASSSNASTAAGSGAGATAAKPVTIPDMNASGIGSGVYVHAHAHSRCVE